MIKYTLESALQATDIEQWVHDYLNSEGNNQAFSEGLKLQKRYFLKPIPLPLNILTRCCGPEDEMPFQISLKGWNSNIERISKFISEGNIPPLICEMKDGLIVNDGNHRYEAYKRNGIDWAYVILWNSQSDELFAPYKDNFTNLISYLFDTVDKVEMISQGYIKQSAIIQSNNKKYILQFDTSPFTSNLKLSEKLVKTNRFEMKKVLRTGQFGGYFELCNFIEGNTYKNNKHMTKKQMKELLYALKEIHLSDVSHIKGYGWLDKQGGSFETAEEFVNEFIGLETKGYWKDWYLLCNSTFLEEKVIDLILAELKRVKEYLYPYRYLVHADIHYGNLIYKNEHLNGIIDWDNAFIGDFIFDLAFVQSVYPQIDLYPLIKDVYNDELDMNDFKERFYASTLLNALDGLRFTAKFDLKDSYQYQKKYIVKLINEKRLN
jgi:thiamine kinase-like enzyme